MKFSTVLFLLSFYYFFVTYKQDCFVQLCFIETAAEISLRSLVRGAGTNRQRNGYLGFELCTKRRSRVEQPFHRPFFREPCSDITVDDVTWCLFSVAHQGIEWVPNLFSAASTDKSKVEKHQLKLLFPIPLSILAQTQLICKQGKQSR